MKHKDHRKKEFERIIYFMNDLQRKKCDNKINNTYGQPVYPERHGNEMIQGIKAGNSNAILTAKREVDR